jgi:hypothetical protein
MQPSERYLPFWLGQTRAPLASVRRNNPQQGIPSTPVTAYHVTQNTDPRNPEVRTRGWICGKRADWNTNDYDIIYLTATGLPPGGSSTVHIYTQTIHTTTQKLGRVRAVPVLCGFYPGICLTTEEKARKNLSQGSLT